MARHLLLVLPLAPDEAPVEPLPDAPAEPLPGAPEEPPEALSDELLPVVAPALLPELPPAPAPDEEPELCASETLDNAKSAAAVAALMSFNVISDFPPYLVVLDPLLPEPLLPEPMPDPLLPAPELGSLAVLPLPDVPLELLPLLPVLPPVAPLAPEPDLLKCASHSARETCPSLFLSTDEKLGVDELAPLDALGEDEEPLEELPEALGVDELPEALGVDELEDPPAALPGLLVSDAAGLEPLDPELPALAPLEPLEPELCAIATLASAKSAAAVAVPTTLNNISISS